MKYSLPTALALVSSIVIGCGGSSSDDRGPVEVLAGEDAVQAAAQNAISVAAAITSLLTATESGPISRASSRSGNRISRAQQAGCELGGTLTGTCREEGNRTVVMSRAMECSLLEDTGIEVISDGELTVTFDATGICGQPALPPGLGTTIELRNFREERRDGNRVIRVTTSSRFRQTLRPTNGGCSGNQGRFSATGDVQTTDSSGSLDIVFDNLDLDVSSAGQPCRDTISAMGRVDVNDLDRGSRFVADLDGLTIGHMREVGGLAELTLDGSFDVDCLGRIELSSLAPITLSGVCPATGSFELSVADGAPATATYSGDGLTIDYDRNGVEDFTSPSCTADTLATCM